MQKQLINLAYIGCGGWAQRYHFPALAHIQSKCSDKYTINLRGITSLELDVAQEIATKYDFTKVYKNIDELISDKEVDAVALAVTPDALTEVLTQVIKLGVPILSEKPPGISIEQAQYLSDLVSVPNLLTFNRRFNPLNQNFRDIVTHMEDITFVQGSFYRYNRLDETFMIGTGIHWINYIEYVFGTIVRVKTHRWRNPENQSWLRTADLTFESGLKGFLKVFPCSGSNYERIEAHSNQQSVYLDGPLWTNPGKIVIDTRNTQQVVEQPIPLAPEIIRLGIVGEYKAFFDLITKGIPSPSTFQNAVNSMRVAEAMEFGHNI